MIFLSVSKHCHKKAESHSFQIRLQEAGVLKTEGNDHFRSNRWNEALLSYETGLSRLPARLQSKESPPEPADTSSGAEKGSANGDQTTQVSFPSSELEECAKVRAVLNSNIGACYVKLVTATVASEVAASDWFAGRSYKGS